MAHKKVFLKMLSQWWISGSRAQQFAPIKEIRASCKKILFLILLGTQYRARGCYPER
jgi:hypothetical protein